MALAKCIQERPTLGAVLLVMVPTTGPASATSSVPVLGWGYNGSGDLNAPKPSSSQYVALSAGYNFTIGLLKIGQAEEAWGDNSFGELDVPAPPHHEKYVQVVAGDSAGLDGGEPFGLALLSDGSVRGWGDELTGPTQCSRLLVQDDPAGSDFGVGVLTDGDAIGWGVNTAGQTNPPPPPAGLTYVSVAAGFAHAVGPSEQRDGNRLG